mmetsp:Transcript_96996/g.211993  ORF Transcript_96996/g.211993 Transcript_96996/m.211993 type:complete len:99 (-) Transcript_96996:33-329(-)
MGREWRCRRHVEPNRIVLDRIDVQEGSEEVGRVSRGMDRLLKYIIVLVPRRNQAKMGGSDEAGKQRKWAQRRCPGPVIDIVEKRLEKDRWRHHDGIAA